VSRACRWCALVVIGLAWWRPTAAAELRELFKRVDPAVVEVFATESGGSATKAIGSGFLVSSDGLVITAAHVVQTADAVTVRFLSGETAPATTLASDPQADVALIRAQRVPAGTPVLPLGDSDRVEVGDQVFVVGAPMGMSHTLSVGHVSARRSSRTLHGGLEPADLLQTDAAINRGNSGGPMLDMTGAVVGVVSHIVSVSGGSEGLGFVVSSNLARRALLEEPTLWTGMSGYLLEGELARALNVPQGSGILVQGVASGSPAARLGLVAGSLRSRIGDEELLLGGDVILSVMGVPVGHPDSAQRIRAALATVGSDGQIAVQVLRAGAVLSLQGSVGAPGSSR
jgi:serine protease Do